MVNRDLETATYVLKIVTPPKGDALNNPVYQLQGKEYHSPQELVNGIIQSQNLHAEETDPGSQPAANLENQIFALQSLLTISKSQLEKIRFSMIDRITSALMKMTLLNTKKQERFSDSEQLWIDQGLSDLTQLSFVIEEWNRLCEVLDVAQLEDYETLNKMITTISSFEIAD